MSKTIDNQLQLDLIKNRLDFLKSKIIEDAEVNHIQEIDSLLELRKMLYAYLQSDNDKEFEVVGGMYIRSSDFSKFVSHMLNVCVPGLDFGINKEEIAAVSSRLEQIDKNDKEFKEEWESLIALKRILLEASKDNMEENIIIGALQIKKADFDRFFELADKVNIPDFIFTKPLKEGDIVPGTNQMYSLPRAQLKDETIPDYEAYLFDFYNKLEYDYPKLHDGELRDPYWHEMLINDHGNITVDKNYFGHRNPYYLSMIKYYKSLNMKEEQGVIHNFDSVDMKESSEDTKEKVTNIELAPIEVVEEAKTYDLGKIPKEQLVATLRSVLAPRVYESGKVVKQEENLELAQTARNIVKENTTSNSMDDMEEVVIISKPQIGIDRIQLIGYCLNDYAKTSTNNELVQNVGQGNALLTQNLKKVEEVKKNKGIMDYPGAFEPFEDKTPTLGGM